MREGIEHTRGYKRNRPNENYNSFGLTTGTSNLYYPTSILDFPWPRRPVHPNEKPVKLMDYLVKTYSNPRDSVLDACMGSGTTGEACVNTGRSFIGIEKERKYYEASCKRLGVDLCGL
jgi:DNA modification methylase